MFRTCASSQLGRVAMHVHAHQGLQAQAADLLHLLDAARHLCRAPVAAALGQLAQNARLVVHAGADDEREAEALLVLGVEPGHEVHVPRAQGVHPGRCLLIGRLLGQGAAPQVPARQVRVAPEDALLTLTEKMDCCALSFKSTHPKPKPT